LSAYWLCPKCFVSIPDSRRTCPTCGTPAAASAGEDEDDQEWAQSEGPRDPGSGDLYGILGVGRGATQDEIRQAYLRRIRRAHPDLNPSGEEEAKRLNVAYETLSNPQRRRQYDDSLTSTQCPFCGMRLAKESGAARRHVMGHLAEMAVGGCAVCGRGPVNAVSYRANSGFVLWRRVYGFDGDLCRACGQGMYREFQARNITRGPWGIISVFAAVWYLLRNTVQHLGHRRGLDAPFPPDEAADVALRGRPVLRRPAVLVVVGAIAALFVYSALSADDTESRWSPQDTTRTTLVQTPGTVWSSTTISDREVWRVGTCVQFATSGVMVWPVECSSPDVDGRVVRIASTASGCPASAEWYVTLENSTVACVDE